MFFNGRGASEFKNNPARGVENLSMKRSHRQLVHRQVNLPTEEEVKDTTK
jgi:hypothetical protein